MGVAARGSASADRRSAHGRSPGARLEPAAAAWIAAIPCAAITAAAAIWLAHPLGTLLYPARLPFRPLPGDPQRISPEPLEGSRYLVLLAATALLTLVTVLAARRLPLSARWRTALVGAAQLLTVGALVACFVNQRRALWHRSYFDPVTLGLAALVASVVVLWPRSGGLRRLAGAWPAEAPRRRAALLALAALVTVVWILPAVNSEASITWWLGAHDNAFHFDETYAVLDGLTPWTTFHAQYASLLPYAIAGTMLLLGKSYLVFTLTLCALSALALLGVYGVLRRAAGGAPAALALYVPFLATSLFVIAGEATVRGTPGTYFPMFPLRYGGAYLLAWLTARRLDRGRPARALPLFAAAGLVLLNNVEFGTAATGATLAALLWTTRPLTPARAGRLVAEALGGIALAVCAYALVSVARSGSLPDFGRQLVFVRLYGVDGFSVAAIPAVLGLPLVIFLTYVAAIATATVRALEDAPNQVLTGMLAWSGVFGLGSATYYVARSDPSLLVTMFSAWALALALLAVVVAQRLVRDPLRRPSLPAIAVAFGMGLMICSVAQVPWPWAQIARVQAPPPGASVSQVEWAPRAPQDPAVRTFVAALADGPHRFVTRRGAPIALFATTGHRIADEYGVVDVVPFTGPESMHTQEQLEEALDALRSAGGNTVLVAPEYLVLMHATLVDRGFEIVARSGLRAWAADGSEPPPDALLVGGLTKWVDTRHLAAPWLHA